MRDYVKAIREKVGNDLIILVGASVYVYSNGKVLLQKRNDNGCWGSNGGYMELGETTEEAARRELFEEAGLAAGKLELLGVFSGLDMMHTYPNGDRVNVVDVAYVCTEFSGDLLAQTNEVSELRWFGIDDIPDNISPPDKRPVAAFVAWARKVT